MLLLLAANREPFQMGAFQNVEEAHRSWAVGYYAERVALAIDRLNQAILAQGDKAPIPDAMIDTLLTVKPPKSFDGDIDIAEDFVRKLDQLPRIDPNDD